MSFVTYLTQYEDSQEANAKGIGDVTQIKIFCDQESGLHKKLETMIDGHVDSVTHLRNWVKGEVLALQSLINAIIIKSGIVNNIKTKAEEIAKLQTDIDKLNTGKFKFRGIFKNDEEKRELAARIGVEQAAKKKDL